MQVGPLPKIVAFIEGSMERIFVNNNFHYVHVVTLSNGEGWSIDAMCKQILSKFLVIGYLPDFVVVWFDRESMALSSESITSKVKESIVSTGYPAEKVAVCIPDKMTENIILADEVVIRSEFGLDDYEYPGDGVNGKAALRGLYFSNGTNYKETYHGAGLLKKTRIDRAASSSASARSFWDQLDLDCWWKSSG